MKMKSLLFGVAGAFAITGVQAADLPAAPEPVDYVRICDAFGSGFYYIPGTETCIRVFGRVRADYNYFSGDTPVWSGVPGDAQAWRFRARAYVRMDTRTNTEYGLLRTFFDIWVTNDYRSANGRGWPQVWNPGGPSSARGSVTLFQAFIQFGGLTAGATASFFDTGFGTTYGFFFKAQRSETWTNVLAYTFAFGNGVSASISLEAPGGVFSNPWGRALGSGVHPARLILYDDIQIPDIVANIRVDQGWGSAQFSVIAHHNKSTRNGSPIFTNVDKFGWGANLGVNFNIPSVNANVFIQGAYGKGVVGATQASWDCGPYFLANAGCIDFNPLNGKQTTSWSISGGVGFSFTPQVSMGIEVGYMDHDYGQTFAETLVAGANYLDFTRWDAAVQISYRPVRGLLFGFALEYRDVDFKQTGGIGGVWTPPTDIQDLAALFRIQRDF